MLYKVMYLPLLNVSFGQKFKHHDQKVNRLNVGGASKENH